jgi:hypothetical protein
MFTIKLQSEDRVTYLPDFQNNRELAAEWIRNGESGPRPFFSGELLPLSARDFNKIAGSEYRVKGGGKRNIINESQRVVRRVMSEYVPTIDNLKFESRGGGIVKPSTGEELFDVVVDGYPGLGDIVDDFFEALKNISVASEGDLKKLRQRFGGSGQPTTQVTSGDALDATQGTSTTMTDPPRQTTD